MPIGSGLKKSQKTDDLLSQMTLKILLLVHLLWQLQFLRRKFVDTKNNL